MVYDKLQIGDKCFWIANPSNWEELAFTITEEDLFLSYDPNGGGRDDLISMFG